MVHPYVLYKHDAHNRVDVSITEDSTRLIDPAAENKANALWAEQLEKCAQKGEKVWDGRSYRLNDFRVEPGTLYIELGPLLWSKRSPLRYVDELHKLDPQYWGRGIFVTAIIKTADNKYIFGSRKETALERTVSTTFGGILSPDDVEVKTFEDFVTMLEYEIDEELGVAACDVYAGEFLEWCIPAAEMWAVFSVCAFLLQPMK